MKYNPVMNKLSSKLAASALILGSSFCQVALADGSNSNSNSNSSKYDMYGSWSGSNKTNTNLANVKNSKITPKNVNQLKLLWHTLIPPNGQDIAVDSTPVLADGFVYNATWGGVLNAYDQKTGALKWTIQLKDDKGANEAFDESPVITKSKIFIAGRMMHAIDRKTGQEIWKTIYDPAFSDLVPNTGFHIPSQLMIAGKNVVYGFAFTSESGNANGAPQYLPYSHGEIVAFNQDTGKVSWRIDLTKDPVTGQQFGPMGTYGGGAVDDERQLLFFGTGNSYTPDISPLSDNFLAIDYNTGKIKWRYQFYDDDAWGNGGDPAFAIYNGTKDLNVAGKAQVFSIKIKDKKNRDKKMDLVGVRAKDGTYRIFDREPDNPQQILPVVQVQFGPATTSAGGIQLDPIIKDDVMYVASTYYKDPNNPLKFTTLDFAVLPPGNVYPNGFDPLAAFTKATTVVRAIDLKKLVSYGLAKNSQNPICLNNKIVPPLCTVDPAFPTNAIIWEHEMSTIMEPLAAAGMTEVNGILLFGSVQGRVWKLDIRNGSEIGQPIAASLNPNIDPATNPFSSLFPVLGFLDALPVLGGISVEGDKIFIPVGLGFYGSPFGVAGGMVVYGLDDDDHDHDHDHD